MSYAYEDPDLVSDQYGAQRIENAMRLGVAIFAGVAIYAMIQAYRDADQSDLPRHERWSSDDLWAIAFLALALIFVLLLFIGVGRLLRNIDATRIRAGFSPTKMLVASCAFIALLFWAYIFNWNSFLWNAGLFPEDQGGFSGSDQVQILVLLLQIGIVLIWSSYFGFYLKTEYGLPRYMTIVVLVAVLIAFLGSASFLLDPERIISDPPKPETDQEQEEQDQQAKDAPAACIDRTIKALRADEDFQLFRKLKSDGDRKAKKKFRSVSIKYHPDRCSDECKDVCNTTYQYLSNQK